MPIYSTVKGFCNFQAPLGPPKDNQKSFKLHMSILWSHVVTSKTIIGLSLIWLILGNPPKLAPARKYRKNADILGDLWPGQILFTIMKLFQYLNISLIYLWAKSCFGVFSPSQWNCTLNIEHFLAEVFEDKNILRPKPCFILISMPWNICKTNFTEQIFFCPFKNFQIWANLPSKLPNFATLGLKCSIFKMHFHCEGEETPKPNLAHR